MAEASGTSKELTLEIVGMVDRTDQMITIGVTAPNYAPVGVFPKNILPENVGAIIDIEPDQIGALRSALSNTPGVFLLDGNPAAQRCHQPDCQPLLDLSNPDCRIGPADRKYRDC